MWIVLLVILWLAAIAGTMIKDRRLAKLLKRRQAAKRDRRSR
jgi:hypothetical protein